MKDHDTETAAKKKSSFAIIGMNIYTKENSAFKMYYYFYCICIRLI